MVRVSPSFFSRLTDRPDGKGEESLVMMMMMMTMMVVRGTMIKRRTT
jgi:hypothetical protein